MSSLSVWDISCIQLAANIWCASFSFTQKSPHRSLLSRKSRNEGWYRRRKPVISFGTSRIACSLSSVCVTCVSEMLITFASEAAGSGDNKIVMLPRILRCLVYNCTFSSGLKVLGIELWSTVRYIWSRYCSGVPSKLVPSRISSSLSLANSSPSPINRHAIAAQIKSPLAWTTSYLRTSSPGHLGPRVHSCPKIPKWYSKKREISWLIIIGCMLYSIKS